MKKPFDFDKIIAGFSVKIRNVSNEEMIEAEEQVRELIDDYLIPNSPYPARKEWVFRDLKDLVKYRESGY